MRRVLVVEDDALVSETIAAMLDGHYETVVAETADKALAYLGSSMAAEADFGARPDLILLDCLLPGGGLSQILGVADQHSVAVVLISGDPERAARIDASRLFLPKPFSQTMLLDTLRAMHD
jgi:DNA-binding response OmpR family regulator